MPPDFRPTVLRSAGHTVTAGEQEVRRIPAGPTTVPVMAQQEDGELDGYAVAVVRESAQWRVTLLDDDVLTDLELAETALRRLRSAGAVFGLLDVDDEFFVVVRPGPSGTRLFLSDATASVEYDIASDVLESLHVDVPDLDPDEIDDIDPWSEGDAGVLSDLGLPEDVLSIIVDDVDLYADEQLGMIADRMGFADELARALSSLGR